MVSLQQPPHVGGCKDIGHSGQLLGGAGWGAADAISGCHGGVAAGCPGPDCRLGCRPTAGCTAAPAVWPRLGPPCTRTDAAAAGSRPVLARPRLPAGPCLPTAPPSLCRPQTPPAPSPPIQPRPFAQLWGAGGAVQPAPVLHSCTAARCSPPPEKRVPLSLPGWPPAWPSCRPTSACQRSPTKPPWSCLARATTTHADSSHTFVPPHPGPCRGVATKRVLVLERVGSRPQELLRSTYHAPNQAPIPWDHHYHSKSSPPNQPYYMNVDNIFQYLVESP